MSEIRCKFEALDYRKSDEFHVLGEDYRRVRQVLSGVCKAYLSPIDVLDLGCGTGRYFHCIKNVKTLTGVDLCPHMIEQAHHPVNAAEISAAKIRLIHADFRDRLPFELNSFDLIYSVGVFGNGSGVDCRLLVTLFSLLKPEGKFFFDCFASDDLPAAAVFRKQLKARLYSSSPRGLRRFWHRCTGWPPFFLSSVDGVRKSLNQAGFSEDWIRVVIAETPSGRAKKIEALATRL